MKLSVCNCDTCEELKDTLRLHKTHKKMWQSQANERRKGEIILKKKAENVPMLVRMESFEEGPDQMLDQERNSKCYPGTTYLTFSELQSLCRAVLLCKEVHIPPLDLPVLEVNFCQQPGKTDAFMV